MLISIPRMIYLSIIILLGFSIFLLVYSIKNKNRSHCKYLSILPVLTAIYMFFILAFVPDILSVYVGMNILFYYAVFILASVICLITLIYNIIKRKKLSKYGQEAVKMPSIFKVIVLSVFLIPVVMIGGKAIRDKVVLANSSVVFVVNARCNGGIGDGNMAGFAITGDYVRVFDLGVDLGLEDILGDSAQRIKPNGKEFEADIYKVVIKNDELFVYEDITPLCQFNAHDHDGITGNFFNLEFADCYVINK